MTPGVGRTLNVKSPMLPSKSKTGAVWSIGPGEIALYIIWVGGPCINTTENVCVHHHIKQALYIFCLDKKKDHAINPRVRGAKIKVTEAPLVIHIRDC